MMLCMVGVVQVDMKEDKPMLGYKPLPDKSLGGK